ncbi:MAG: tRNA lysidine(34) synthetase TilS [Gammaproteobacteria bacterium]
MPVPDHVRAVLDRHPGRRWCIAFSGGLDSTVLLHALASLRDEHPYALRALHVDHGMHADSAAWATHCIRTAAALDIPCTVLRVAVDARGGSGPEAAARDARYAAFALELDPDEGLLTAQHADDQAETVLLALLRGSGPAGLAAMPESAPLGAGLLVRPLLGCSRDTLAAWARELALEWIDDPSNANTGLARNFLRQRVMPALHERWPAVAESLARSASLAAEADTLLAAFADLDLEALSDGTELDADGVSALGPVRARNVLRRWIARLDLPVAPYERLLEAERQLREAGDDRVPTVEWPGAVLRRWQGRLFAERPQPEPQSGWAIAWDGKNALQLPDKSMVIELTHAKEGIAAAKLAGVTLRVAFRSGGERLRTHPLGPHRVVKDLLAEAGVPPWRRGRIPFLFAGDQLVAVGDLFVDADWAASEGEQAVRAVLR